MWVHHFNASLDNLPEFDPYGANSAYGIMKRHFMDDKWFEIYDFLEFVVQNWSGGDKDKIATAINSILEKEACAFRFVGKDTFRGRSNYYLTGIRQTIPILSKRPLAQSKHCVRQ